jgi:chromosome segregation ATPase
MFLGLLTLLVAFSISAIAAYYSIIGLTAIFAAAFLPIILMGGVLEVGKILTTVWLHQNWHRAPLIMRSYLTVAVIVLMFITSMGVFGFLSKSHIQQSSVGTEQLAQAQVVDQKMARIEAKINRWQQEMQRLNAGETSGRIDTLISRERERIAEAQEAIKPQIEAENSKIPALREQANTEIQQQNKRLNDAQSRSKSNIEIAQAQLAQLDKDVAAYTKKGVVEGTFNDTDLVARGAKLRQQQKPQRDELQQDIEKSKRDELSVAARVQGEITKINARLAQQIQAVDARIVDIRKSILTTVTSANDNIARYTSDAGSTNKDIDGKLIELERKIASEQPIIDQLREEKFVFEREYRQFEAEVGPVKYIAELIYGDADRNLLEAAVRWVIIIIVAVFDPLAVCLVLAGSMTIGWANKERRDKKIKAAGIVVDPRVEELEMQLNKHNEILEELEKLLDQNIGNIDATEYAKLQTEYASMLAEKSELESALANAQNETDLLVDKVVTTEEERDNYKKQIDDLVAGTGSFQSRIEELVNRIAELESEVDRRDQVVIKMAQKYQLVEKDEFANDLVTEATGASEKNV